MDENEIYSELLKSRKYAEITPDVLHRVCRDAVLRFPKKKDAVKAAKTELHIINDSYLLNDCHKNTAELIENYSGKDILSDKEFSVLLSKNHASTKERLQYAEEIYSFVSGYVSREDTLGDIGCGFNPFCLPFFVNKPKRYFAYEINNDTVGVLNSYFEKSAHPDYNAYSFDAVGHTPDIRFNTVFLFKLLPVLQQQKKGRAFEILHELDFDTAVVSFPLKSLSGKEKGMASFYSSFFEEGLGELLTLVEKREIGNELFYVIKKAE